MRRWGKWTIAAVPALTALFIYAAVAQTARTPSPKGAEVYIITPKDGAVVTSPVTVRFGLKGMGVAPAGTVMENTGHHHLLIDTDAPKDLSQPLPASEHIVHYGKGQTETELTLTPGKHTLQLLLGDHMHTPHNPAVMSKKIVITVKDSDAKAAPKP